MSSGSIVVASFFVLLLGLASCGGGNSTQSSPPPPSPPPPSPATLPTITSISPSSAAAGGASFTLTVTGSGFNSYSVLQFGACCNVISVSPKGDQLTATIPASVIANAGSVEVSVCNCNNADFVGPVSNAVTFAITTPSQTITSISPSGATAGGAQFTLTVNGSGFLSASVVRWNDSDRATTFISATQLTASIPSSDIAIGGVAQVRVFNEVPEGGTSNSAAFPITAASGAGSIDRVSVASDGTQANGDSFSPAVSADGRFIAFQSYGTNLVADDTNGVHDVFFRDTCQGAPAGCTPSTIRVSVASDGTQANGDSGGPTAFDDIDRIAISANGRLVAFSSHASNLVSDDTNVLDDVFLRDTCQGAPAGCMPSTTRVSVNNDGSQIMFPSASPALSADGRFVAFLVLNQVVPGSINISVRDTCFGALPGCTLSTTMVPGDSNFDPWLSADGRFITFESPAGVFFRDTCFGAMGSCMPSTTLASVKNDGSHLGYAFDSTISAAGRFVGFVVAGATDPLTGALINSDVLFRDTCAETAGCAPSTTLTFDGGASIAAFQPSLSADGHFMAVQIVRPDSSYQILVLDTCVGAPTGCVPSTILSVETANNLASQPSLTADGRFVAFASAADDLIAGDTNKSMEIFLARTGH